MRTIFLIPLLLWTCSALADAGPLADAGLTDGGSADIGPSDAGASDAGPAPLSLADAGAVDAGGNAEGQTDAGTLDGGALDAGITDGGSAASNAGDGGLPARCTEQCQADGTLSYCDDDALVTLNCAEVGGICGALNPAWGLDCLLPEGAPCDPGYADGASRCNGATGLYCDVDTCTRCGAGLVCETQFPPAPTAGTTSGGFSQRETASGSATSCLGCSTSDIPLFGLVVVFGLRGLRRRFRVACLPRSGHSD